MHNSDSTTFEDRLRAQLEAQIERQEYTFARTPTLATVESWVNLRKLFRGLGGSNNAASEQHGAKEAMEELATRILSRKRLDSRKKLIDRRHPLYILAESMTVPNSMETLKKHVGAVDIVSFPGEASVTSEHDIPLLKKGQQIIVHADVIDSAESVRISLGQVLRDNAEPIAVSCIVDGRKEPDDIEIWETRVPVVSLIHRPLVVNDPPEPTNDERVDRFINPQNNRTEYRSHPDPFKYEIEPREMLDIATKNRSLFFTHVGGPYGRHFTFYVDATSIVANQQVDSLIHQTVTDWTKSQSGMDQTMITVLYPNELRRTRSAAAIIATSLAHRADVRQPVRKLLRESHFQQWRFVRDIEYQVEKTDNALFVDWGAMSGTTIMHLLAMAAKCNANRARVLIAISQLPSYQEEFLRSITRLRRSTEINLPTSAGTATDIAVDVRFIGYLPITAFSDHDCPVCKQLRRLKDEHYPTVLIKQFADDQTNKLKARQRADIAKMSEPKDLDGRVLSPAALTWMIGFRQQLVAAQHSTHARFEILADIKKMNATSKTLRWLLNFLAVESDWLVKPPLRFQKMRVILAELALSVVVNNRNSVSDRGNAINVLRTANRRRFARELLAMFQSASGNNQLIAHLCYGTYTYLDRPYLQSEVALQPIADALDAVNDAIGKRHLQLERDQVATVHALLDQKNFLLAKLQMRSKSRATALRQLKREFQDLREKSHDSVREAIRKLDPSSEMSMITKVEGSTYDDLIIALNNRITDWERSWNDCRAFLNNYVFPSLAKNQAMLLSTDVHRILGPQESTRLHEMCQAEYITAQSDFSYLIREIVADPTRVKDADLRQRYIDQYNWWVNTILQCESGQNLTQSRLVHLLDSFPTRVRACLEEEVTKLLASELKGYDIAFVGSITNREWQVFSPDFLARDLFDHILMNVKTHRPPNQRKNPKIRISIEERGQRIDVRIVNDGTSTSIHNQRQGLRGFQRRLSAWDARIAWTSPLPGTGATFQVTISFASWR